MLAAPRHKLYSPRKPVSESRSSTRQSTSSLMPNAKSKYHFRYMAMENPQIITFHARDGISRSRLPPANSPKYLLANA